MKKYLTVIAAFIIMLCLGSVYAWSLIASELIKTHGFSASQTQVIFGALIGVFPLTMIYVGRLGKALKHRILGYISSLLFFTGYLIAGISKGNFILVLLGIGIIGGISTGFGYWVALTSPVKWFPEKKGLITGIAAGGFGLGALIMSEISEAFFSWGFNVMSLLKVFGIGYGLTIFIFSNFLFQIPNKSELNDDYVKTSEFIKHRIFKKLFLGIFLGTFAGLLIIGSLKIIGEKFNILNHFLVLGVVVFAITNFLGRLIWGGISDHIGASFSIFLALLVQSISIFLLIILNLSNISYLIVTAFIGFGFGGNFVLFAKETAQVYGIKNLGIVYPYVFIGYAIAGIAGPTSGGLLYDISGTYFYSIALAGFISLLGSMLFLKHFISIENNK